MKTQKGALTPRCCSTACWPRIGCSDLVENFVLFDDSRARWDRKIVARNHQVLGVNNAVASVLRQEELKTAVPARTSGSAYRDGKR